MEPSGNAGPKVVIVGAGLVGSCCAYAMMIEGTASNIVLVDRDMKKAEGEAMDLTHGLPFVRPATITAGQLRDCRDADVVVITAGVKQGPGETRLDLVQKNAGVFREIIPEITSACSPDTVLVVVTNPVDVMTHLALRISRFEPRRVIGSGTVLDTARFRYALSAHCGVDARNIHAYIIGEHGDTEVPAWSLTNIAGVRLSEFCPACERACPEDHRKGIFERVREAAYEIIERKGATYYAVGLAVKKIAESILKNENSVLTVSGLVDGLYGLKEACLSLPSIVNREGRVRILELPLAPGEIEGLQRSAEVLKRTLDAVTMQSI